MADQRKQSLSRQEVKRLRRFILLVGVISVLFLLFVPGRGYMNYRSMQKQLTTLLQENKRLALRNKELAAEIETLQADDAYFEELARKKYGLLKENETVYEFKSRRKKSDSVPGK